MKVIYIAGKYRDERGEYWVRQNIRAAEAAAVWVWSNGGVALCPHKNTAGFGGANGLPDNVWLAGDLELLERCNAIFLIPGWEDSDGAKAELSFAKAHGIKVLLSYEEVKYYLLLEGKGV